MLFENKDYHCQIVPPDKFVLSNPVIVGECSVIAKTFTELLNLLVQNNGEHRYWRREDFQPLEDAYDEIDDIDS